MVATERKRQVATLTLFAVIASVAIWVAMRGTPKTKDADMLASVDGVCLGVPSSLVKKRFGTADSAYGGVWYYRLEKTSGSPMRIISFDAGEHVNEVFGFALYDRNQLLVKAGDSQDAMVEILSDYRVRSRRGEYYLQGRNCSVKINVRAGLVVSFELAG